MKVDNTNSIDQKKQIIADRKSIYINCVKGFTLIEVLASIVIFAVLIAIIMNVVAGSLMVSRNTEITTRSVVLCVGKMDEVRARIFGRSTNPDYLYGWDRNYSEAAAAFPSPHPDYKYTVADPDYPAALIRDIAVTVWYDRDDDSILDSDERGITFNTKVARRD